MEVDDAKSTPTPPTALKDEADSHDNVRNVPPASDSAEADDTSKPTIWIQEPGKENGDEDSTVQNDSFTRGSEINPSHTMTVVHSRRNANGTIGSVYSGNKIRHLKKEDGVPLWRKDIQHAFLLEVFENKEKVFTLDSDGSKGHTFADIYIHAMARSTKTSKVLREKLLDHRESAQKMAMICLLVNVGRMNTTLNFFPEMRAQLRTYHSIPCLQAQQDANSQNKGLQDAPRLKSILKGACEDPNQPSTIEQIQSEPVPRTNPVNLIFVMSQYAPKVSETHFFQPRDFFDLVIRSTWSSKSRATAFLWLMWWYLESDFSDDAALNNPFGAGIRSDDESGQPLKVPDFECLTEDQANEENVDTPEEVEFGEKMAEVRKSILEADEGVGPAPKKAGRLSGVLDDDRVGASPARSDVDRTRSPSPTTLPPLKMPKPRKLVSAQDGMDRSDAEGRAPARIVLKTKVDRAIGSSSPGPGLSVGNRRARPETSHQRAVNLNRKMRIESILHKKLVREQNRLKRLKRATGFNRSFLSMKRISGLSSEYDSEEELSTSIGGLDPGTGEMQDFGSEALSTKKVFDRILRRLGRDEARQNPQSIATREFREVMQKRKERREELPVLDERYKRPLGTGRRGRGSRGGRRGGGRAQGGRLSGVSRGVGQQEGQDAEPGAGGEVEVDVDGEGDGDLEGDGEGGDIEMDMGEDVGGADDDSGDDSGEDDSDGGDDATEDGMEE